MFGNDVFGIDIMFGVYFCCFIFNIVHFHALPHIWGLCINYARFTLHQKLGSVFVCNISTGRQCQRVFVDKRTDWKNCCKEKVFVGCFLRVLYTPLWTSSNIATCLARCHRGDNLAWQQLCGHQGPGPGSNNFAVTACSLTALHSHYFHSGGTLN